jgi:hypothetical protein
LCDAQEVAQQTGISIWYSSPAALQFQTLHCNLSKPMFVTHRGRGVAVVEETDQKFKKSKISNGITIFIA